MKQQTFEKNHCATWELLETEFGESTPKSKNEDKPQFDKSRFAPLYRETCHHLAQAKHRSYSPHLVDRLNRLVLVMHNTLYSNNSRFRYQGLRFLIQDFPQALYDNRRYIGISAALFLLPGLFMFIACLTNDSMIYTMMEPVQVRQFEAMYDPANSALGRERQSDTDLAMFGYYIQNNIGISFRTFASGIAFGLGSIFFMVFNGLNIGAVFGHITRIGFEETFYPFVVGHGSFELTAIVFSGAAGLKMGFTLLAPGSYRRLTALRLAANDAIRIIYGSTLMLLIAAFLEAFWSSSSTLPVAVKYGVGALLWVLVLGWCTLAARKVGRRRLGS
ncbi:stage II sporulation protein M [Parendozoicomonas sp. Alg238-R29]|uniref:stage II sporulation protein M n=1 Tax=Parendozoicomonas sp. Alg238-R29 TaxID=2993446 RepID=UPI00248EC734|nr:stage II sporulation protein M [Parendozoicomonas sp. Alg238-R29]